MRVSNRVFWAAIFLIGCCILSGTLQARQGSMFIQTKNLKGTLSADELDVRTINVVNADGHVAFSVYCEGKTAVMELGDGVGGTSPFYMNLSKDLSPNITMIGPDFNMLTLNVGPSGPFIFLDGAPTAKRANKTAANYLHMGAGSGGATYLELSNAAGAHREITPTGIK